MSESAGTDTSHRGPDRSVTEWFWRCYQIKRPYIQRDHALSTKPVTFIDTVNVCAVHSLRYSRLSNLRKKYEQRENKLYIVSHIEHDHSRITNLNFHEIACFCEIMKMYTRKHVYVHSSLCDVVTYSIHLLIQRCLVRIHLTPGVAHNFQKTVGVQDLCPLCTKRFQIPICEEKGATPGILVSRLNNAW